MTNLVNLNWDTSLTGVGRDARGLQHNSIRIRGIYHVQNKKMLYRYLYAHGKAKTRYTLPQELKNSPIATDSVKPWIHDEPEATNSRIDGKTSLALGSLQLYKSEAFLFHGTTRIAINSIVQEGFKLRYCKRGPFGNPGIYLSEHAQKADQYTDKTGRRSTDLYMLGQRW